MAKPGHRGHSEEFLVRAQVGVLVARKGYMAVGGKAIQELSVIGQTAHDHEIRSLSVDAFLADLRLAKDLRDYLRIAQKFGLINHLARHVDTHPEGHYTEPVSAWEDLRDLLCHGENAIAGLLGKHPLEPLVAEKIRSLMAEHSWSFGDTALDACQVAPMQVDRTSLRSESYPSDESWLMVQFQLWLNRGFSEHVVLAFDFKERRMIAVPKNLYGVVLMHLMSEHANNVQRLSICPGCGKGFVRKPKNKVCCGNAGCQKAMQRQKKKDVAARAHPGP